MPVTYADAVRVAIDGSYKNCSDAELREMLGACVDISGPNPIAMHRISHAAGIIRGELAGRESASQHKQTQRVAWIAAILSAVGIAVGVVQCVAGPGAVNQGMPAASSPPSSLKPAQSAPPSSGEAPVAPANP
jgi:hypothetical protein